MRSVSLFLYEEATMPDPEDFDFENEIEDSILDVTEEEESGDEEEEGEDE